MKEKSSFGRGAAVALLLIFSAFLIYQIWNGLSDKITTIDALSVTVEELIPADATFIRNQFAISGSVGASEFIVENGEKVSVNQGLLMSFNDEQTAAAYRELKDIRYNIEALTYIDSLIYAGSDGAKLDTLVYTRLNTLLSEINDGNILKADKSYITLRQLVIARDAGLYDRTALTEKIKDLEAQAQAHQDKINRSSNTVISDRAGYFLYKADGYENIFSEACIDTLTSEYLSEKRNSPQTLPDNTVGAIVDSFFWYMAVEVNAEQAAALAKKQVQNQTVAIYIPNISSKAEEFTVEKINKSGNYKSIVVFKSAVMSADYLSTRFQNVDIVLSSHTGIKVPKEALHQKDGEWGVYCMEGAAVKFKKVKWIYHTDSFYLLEMAESSSKGVYLHDKIVLGGKGIDD